MKVNVYGLGYVGSVTSLCLASLGHDVLGVELVPEKVKAFASGRLPIYEPGLDELFQTVQKTKQFQVSLHSSDSRQPDVFLVCVGTPSLPHGGVDLSQITDTIATIGQQIAQLDASKQPVWVVVRSTIPPGTTENILIPLLEEKSGKKNGQGFHICFYPEFLREGRALKDFFQTSLNIVGAANNKANELIDALFPVNQKSVLASFRAAEMVKYANNSFHALKVTFANEMGALSQSFGVNSDELMELFALDKTLNLSGYYLKPGFAFGGSCLPKELRSVTDFSRQKNVRTPLLQAILPSNEEHVNRLILQLEESGCHRIGFTGVTFKPDTDDTRESPILEVIERLLRAPSYKKPFELSIFDRPAVCERVKKNLGERVRATSSVRELTQNCQLIVLGPQALEQDGLEALQHFNGKILDLKWHKLPAEMRAKPTYKVIC